MPYFHNDNIHLLLLHIPKTGGTSIDKYLSKKYEIPLERYKSFHSVHSHQFFEGISPQHQFYSTIKRNPQSFSVEWDDPKLQIVAPVRNPYHRVVSAMIFHAFISAETSPVDFMDHLPRFTQADWVDNHNVPQYKFVTMDDETVAPEINIIKTESLTSDMHNLGFNDFDLFINKCSEPHRDYMTYFNDAGLAFMNDFYKKDFELFGYDMIWSSPEK